MSKLNSLGQSMAALFSPEGEKLRKAQSDRASPAGAGGAGNPFRVPGLKPLGEPGGAQDSLGNPSSPGYERLDLSKKTAEAASQDQPAGSMVDPGFRRPDLGPQYIRLSLGWDKLLLAQKKLCDKAKGLFTILEGPVKYHGQRKSTALQSKSRGAILDIDADEERQKADEIRKEAAKKEAA